MNRDKLNSMESFLGKENLKLVIENILLKEQLKCKEIISDEELEKAYQIYYDKSNEVLRWEKCF